jgi:hypothetical protein
VNNLIVPVVSYVWNWGDGSAEDTLKGPDAKHTYTRAGTFYPTVTIITAECTFSSEPKKVEVIDICDDDGSGGGNISGGGGSGFE